MTRMIQENRKTRATLPKSGFFSRPRRFVLALSLGVGLCMVWMLEVTGVPHYWKMTQELEQTKEDIAELERGNAAFREEIRLVESDPFTLEQLARERLGYAKEGETVYQFVESP